MSSITNEEEKVFLERKKFSLEENFSFIKVFFTFLHFLCAGLHLVTTVGILMNREELTKTVVMISN